MQLEIELHPTETKTKSDRTDLFLQLLFLMKFNIPKLELFVM